MGLNSGEVVVGKIGDDLRMDYTAQGPHGGARGADGAARRAGEVTWDRHTAKLVRGLFPVEDLGRARGEGRGRRRRACSRSSASGRCGLASTWRVPAAFPVFRRAGRRDDMLETALSRALEGHGQVSGSSPSPASQESPLLRVRRALSRNAASASSRPTRWRTGAIPLLRGWSSCGTPSASGAGRRRDGAPEDRGLMLLLDPRFTTRSPSCSSSWVFPTRSAGAPPDPGGRSAPARRHHQTPHPGLTRPWRLTAIPAGGSPLARRREPRRYSQRPSKLLRKHLRST